MLNNVSLSNPFIAKSQAGTAAGGSCRDVLVTLLVHVPVDDSTQYRMGILPWLLAPATNYGIGNKFSAAKCSDKP